MHHQLTTKTSYNPIEIRRNRANTPVFKYLFAIAPIPYEINKPRNKGNHSNIRPIKKN